VKAVLAISGRDNVATALEALDAGRLIEANGVSVTALERIAAGHKIALRAIAMGDAVVKYGSPIGLASRAIEPGAHVHTHNLASTRGRGDLDEGASAAQAAAPPRAADAARPGLAEPPDTPATTQAASRADE
jgi:altronate hydrolase